MNKQNIAVGIIAIVVITSCVIAFSIQNNKISKLEYAANSIQSSANSELKLKDENILSLSEKAKVHSDNEEYFYSVMESYAETDYVIYSKEESKFFYSLSKDRKALYSRAYDEGFDDGYENGYDEGHYEGYEEGYDEAHNAYDSEN